jgi:hypothetical protein
VADLRESRDELHNMHAGLGLLKSALQREQHTQGGVGDDGAAQGGGGGGKGGAGFQVHETVREGEPGEEEEEGGADSVDPREELWKAMARKVEDVRREERDRASQREEALKGELVEARAAGQQREREHQEEKQRWSWEQEKLRQAWADMKEELMMIVREEEEGEAEAAVEMAALVARFQEEKNSWLAEKAEVEHLWNAMKQQLRWYQQVWEQGFWGREEEQTWLSHGGEEEAQEQGRDSRQGAMSRVPDSDDELPAPPSASAPSASARLEAGSRATRTREDQDPLLASSSASLSLRQREALIFASTGSLPVGREKGGGGDGGEGEEGREGVWSSQRSLVERSAGACRRSSPNGGAEPKGQDLRSLIDVWASNRAKTIERMRLLSHELPTLASAPSAPTMAHPAAGGGGMQSEAAAGAGAHVVDGSQVAAVRSESRADSTRSEHRSGSARSEGQAGRAMLHARPESRAPSARPESQADSARSASPAASARAQSRAGTSMHGMAQLPASPLTRTHTPCASFSAGSIPSATAERPLLPDPD